MSVFFVIECSCGHSLSTRRQALRNNPSGTMRCRGQLKDGSQCGREYDNTELIRIMDAGTNVYYAQPDRAQMHIGQ